MHASLHEKARTSRINALSVVAERNAQEVPLNTDPTLMFESRRKSAPADQIVIELNEVLAA